MFKFGTQFLPTNRRLEGVSLGVIKMNERKSYEHIFRAYDIRGIFSKDLFPHTALEASAIFGNLIQEREGKLVGVAGDGRQTTQPLINAVVSGIASSGLNVKQCEALPIPVFNFTIWQYLDGGAYVSASHNPPEWNGIRFRKGDGTGFSKENQIVKERFLNNRIDWASWNATGKILSKTAKKALTQYSTFIHEQGFMFDENLQIVVDTRNGVGGAIVPNLYGENLTVTSLHGNIDPKFEVGSPDPVHGNVRETQDIVRKHDFDGGVIFDGDADRAVLVDEKGDIVPAEVMAILMARELLNPGDTVVYNVSCSSIIKDKLEEEKINTIESKVGDVFVSEALKEHNAQLGVEGSYHFFLPKFGFFYDDAIFFTYALFSLLSRLEKPISQLVDAIGTYPVTKSNIKVRDAQKPQVMEKLREKLGKEYEIKTIDGLKVYLHQGNVLIRPSNTEPVIRIRTEWKRESALTDIHKKFKKMVMEARKEAK